MPPRLVPFAFVAAVASLCAVTASGGTPPCGLGLCAVDVVWRRWTSNGVLDPTGPADTRRMLQDARTYGFTWMRVALSPFWPVDLRGAVDNPDKFWGVVDGVVADAAAANVSIGFDLAWNIFAFVDVTNDSLGALTRDAASPSRQLLWNWTATAVTRYANNPAVGWWELTNELNLLVDLNMTGRDSDCNLKLGSPSCPRTAADNMSTTDMVSFTTDWVSHIRRLDPLHRPVSSGHSIPRPQAWHLQKSYHAPSRDWSSDTRQQFRDVMVDINVPPGFDMASVHVYNHSLLRWGITNSLDPVPLLSEAATAMAPYPQQKLYLGEFGQQYVPNQPRQYTRNTLAALQSLNITTGSLWVWEMKGQQDTFAVYPTRDAPIVADMQATNAALLHHCAAGG